MKLIFRLKLALCLVLVFNFAATAQNKYTWKEGKQNGYTYKYVENDPTGARFYTLKNGLTVILAENHKEPNIQTYVAVKAGAKTDPATHTGLAHYLEHMLFKGTDKFGTLDYAKEAPLLEKIEALYEEYNHTTDETKRKEIYREIDEVSNEAAKYAIANEYDKLMSAMGARGTNAFTSFEETVYTENIPASAVDKYLAVQAERFRNPVFRIFHTELEAVYEEKNRTLDNDGRKVFETMFEELFKKHNYGLQTTIGTIDHLKNPSLVEIRKYFDTYYVPNNMGVIMVGDFNIDTMIEKVDKAFGYMERKDLKPYTFEQETPIAQPIKREVLGPEAERVMIGYRFPGSSSKDAQMLELMSSILANGSAGLIDLNLVKKQRLLGASAFPYVLKDYGMLLVSGMPIEGQSLDEVTNLLLKEIDNIKEGNFSEEIITSISNNMKKSNINTFASSTSSASILMDHFTSETDWGNTLDFSENITKISKKDIMDFAKKYLQNNYVVVYKKQGRDPNAIQVDKPEITAVEVNREAESDFLGYINNIPETSVEPVWLDYKKDIDQSTLGNYPLLSVQNKNNDLFSLYYHFNTGSYANKLLPLAASYIDFVGTNTKTAEEVTQAFYSLATSFGISVQGEETYIYISGLQENFDKSVELFHDLIQNAQIDEEALKAYINRIKSGRENSKKNKGAIQRGLLSYAQYGADNPFNYGFTNEELDNITAKELLQSLKDLLSYQFKILYYGPKTNKEIGKEISSLINTKRKINKEPKTKEFKQRDIKSNEVYFADYDMVQVEVTFYRNAGKFDAGLIPDIRLFNEYFGGGMGSIVFQTIRESKALAYSTYAGLSTASRLSQQNTFSAYVGAQNDKFEDAVEAMHELLNEFPASDRAFGNAKEAMQKKLVADRVNDASILFSYLGAQRLGLDYDIRKETYEKLASLELSDLNNLHKNIIQKKPYAYCIITDEENIDEEQLKALGEIKKLTLEEIFGY